jgi:prepilin-type N-terminal cleavage/methylation domain-containing protein
MKQDNASMHGGFTLVELLVVITILAIISITAYTSFSGATDKAKNSTKIGHIASIETGLSAFFADKNYYPMPSQYSAKNLWGYSGSLSAQIANTFSGSKNGDQILSVSGGLLTL